MTQEQKQNQEKMDSEHVTLEDLLKNGFNQNLFGYVCSAHIDDFVADIEKMLLGVHEPFSLCECCESDEHTSTVQKLQLLSEISREVGVLDSQIEVFQINRAHLLERRATLLHDLVGSLTEKK